MFAKRMNATTREVKASHVAFASHPDKVVDLIAEAADANAARRCGLIFSRCLCVSVVKNRGGTEAFTCA